MNSIFSRWICILFLGIVLLSGCATPVSVKHVTAEKAIDIVSEGNAKTILFKKVAINLPRGTRYGSMSGGLFCELPLGNYIWEGGKVTLSEGAFSDVFREELEKANYKVVGSSDALFDDPSEWKAELLIGGLVQDMRLNVCVKTGIPFKQPTSKGEAYVKVEWQIYSRLGREVVYKKVTEGSSRIDEPTAIPANYIIQNAFAMATQNLLADRGFHDLVTKKESEPTKPSFEDLEISKTTLYKDQILGHINDVRAAVATVFAGLGHGSGFFISSDGLLLTNSHVVGESRFVKVKLVTGSELLGEVLRSDRRRDVALIKVEEGNMISLPIRTSSIAVSEEVYCIGSPLHEEFSTTTSKGIVSGYHSENEMKFIQSDVNVLPGSSGGPLLDSKGNAVGLTVSGIILSGAPSGLNFFIPISDALEQLGIKYNSE